MRPLLALALLAFGAPALAQRSDFDWSRSVPAGTVVSVHNINGDIAIVPGSGSRVEVSAVYRGGSRNSNDVYVDVKEYAGSVVVCVLRRGTEETCDENGANMRSRNSRWDDDARMDVTVR